MIRFYIIILILLLITLIFLVCRLVRQHHPSKLFYTLQDIPRLQLLIDNYEIIKNEGLLLCKNIQMLDKERPTIIWTADCRLWREYFEYLETHQGWLHGLKLYSEDMYNFPIYTEGKFFANSSLCPKTTKILKKIGGVNMAGFSLLKAKSKLRLHIDAVGAIYGTIACNFGLDCDDSTLYVDDIPVQQMNNNVLLFDSTHSHYVINHSNRDRLILYIDLKIYD